MLYLLPNLLAPQENGSSWFAPIVAEAVLKLDGLIAESEKEGRVFLKHFKLKKTLQETPIKLLNEHTTEYEIEELLAPCMKGETWGLVSDAGLPCLADPGSALVFLAKLKKIPVLALPGPSSILMAMMLSGLSGQRFAFHGYLPKKPEERKVVLQQWERNSRSEKATQIFMEVPYKNAHAFESVLETLSPKTLFSVAMDLTMPTEWVQTLTIEKWKQVPKPDLAKRPAIFLISQ